MRAPPSDADGVKLQHRRGSARGQSIPASLQGILDSFAGCFTRPSHENFIALVCGWILCPGRHCISRVIQFAAGPAARKHFATFYRFLSRAKWSSDELGRVLFKLLLRVIPEEVEVQVDDTLCRHSGPRIFGASMHHDAARSSYGHGGTSGRASFFACGHCWVVLSVRLPLPWDSRRGVAIPILFRLYRSKKRCDTRSYRKRTELGRDLISLLESWMPPGYGLCVTGDREYASKTVVRELSSRTDFVGPMPMDAALYEIPGRYSGMGRPRKRGRRLASPERMVALASMPWQKVTINAYGRRVKLLIKERTCLWYTVAGTRLVRVIVTRDPKGRAEDRAYFGTDLERTVAEILERFTRRWLLEVCFRDVKQHMGLQHAQNGWGRSIKRRRGAKKSGPQPRGNRGRTAVLHTVPLAFAAYAIVVIWYAQHGAPERDVERVRSRSPWYRRKTTPSFADMLVALRRETWAATLSEDPADRRLYAKLKRLLPDALLAA